MGIMGVVWVEEESHELVPTWQKHINPILSRWVGKARQSLLLRVSKGRLVVTTNKGDTSTWPAPGTCFGQILHSTRGKWGTGRLSHPTREMEDKFREL